MKHRLLVAVSTVLLVVVRTGASQPWEFGRAVDVTPIHGDGIFHHLESAGRRSIALSGSTVAVAWEDNRDGTPRVYLARKRIDASDFDAAVRISGDGEAFEPSIVGFGEDRFAVAWEEDDRVVTRLAAAHALGPVSPSSDVEGTQANLSAHADRLYLTRSQRVGAHAYIRLRVMREADHLELLAEDDCVVDATQPTHDQLYPSSAVVDDGLVVAWEDRRAGHTIILASASRLDSVCRFTAPVRVSENPPGKKSNYGKGHGVARVALGRFGASDVLAVWADKRNYWEGYDIYAAAYAGNGIFSSNSKVQDEFGDFARQWHASVTGNANGMLVVAWDDEREGNSDIALSWFEEGEWSDDLLLPNASGAGHQAHSSIVIDSDGNLHVAWIERTEINGPTRLRYQYGRAVNE